jgi:hypothetical protein
VHLLYLDESGNPNDPADRHFILAGVCVFERVTYFVSEDMERLQSALFPDTEPLEFHANEIRAGKGFWRSRQPDERQAALDGLRDVILKAHKPGLRLFAAVVQKRADCYGDEAVKRATEIMCQSFDHHLKQCYQVKKDPQRGLLVVAQSRFDDRSKLWVRDFRKLGTQWGTIDNLADTPLFASTKDSRLLQLADYVSHAAYRCTSGVIPLGSTPFLGGSTRPETCWLGSFTTLRTQRPAAVPRACHVARLQRCRTPRERTRQTGSTTDARVARRERRGAAHAESSQSYLVTPIVRTWPSGPKTMEKLFTRTELGVGLVAYRHVYVVSPPATLTSGLSRFIALV